MYMSRGKKHEFANQHSCKWIKSHKVMINLWAILRLCLKKIPYITMDPLGFNKASQSDPLPNNIISHITTII